MSRPQLVGPHEPGGKIIGEGEGPRNVVAEQRPQADGFGDVVHLDPDDLKARRNRERSRMVPAVEERAAIPLVPSANRRGDLRAVELAIELVQIFQHETRMEMIDERFRRAVDRIEPGSVWALRVQNEPKVL